MLTSQTSTMPLINKSGEKTQSTEKEQKVIKAYYTSGTDLSTYKNGYESPYQQKKLKPAKHDLTA